MSHAVKTALSQAITEAFTAIAVAPPATISLERPARREHGDWSSNAALAAAKAAGRNPRELAAALAAHLEAAPPAHVTKVEIAGPGFVNFHLADSWLHQVVADVIEQGTDGYAVLDLGKGVGVNIEYVSANPTGPLHAGHARWAAFGDALARVMARCGWVVHREFYVNDRGVQMEIFGASLQARKDGVELAENGYAGQYVRDWAAEMPDGVDPVEWGRAKALDYQRTTLARMNVVFDTWTSEKAIAASGAVEATLAELRAKGHVYEGTTAEGEADAAAEAADAPAADAHDEDAGGGSATWLRTSAFGDDKDRVLVKADGQYTYFMPDIAFHRDKFNRGDHLIDILGADHHGYVRRMKAAIQCLGHDPKDLEILIGQNCVLLRAGVEVKLSKRTGDIVELAEIIDEVGPDAARLTFLLQSIDTRQKVDLAVVASKSMDNPVFYVQYAHARVHGIMRKAAERGIVRDSFGSIQLSQLAHERELDIARVLAELPDALTLACHDRAPHKITTWVRELAAAVQGFYHDCPILRDDVPPELRQARLWLVESARIGLAIGLDLLGVHAPERMDDLSDDTDTADDTDTTELEAS